MRSLKCGRGWGLEDTHQQNLDVCWSTQSIELCSGELWRAWSSQSSDSCQKILAMWYKRKELVTVVSSFLLYHIADRTINECCKLSECCIKGVAAQLWAQHWTYTFFLLLSSVVATQCKSLSISINWLIFRNVQWLEGQACRIGNGSTWIRLLLVWA